MRLFLAIPLPPSIRSHLSRFQRQWQTVYCREWGGDITDFSTTPADNLHITLKFLGELPDPTPVISALRTVAQPGPLSLRAESLQFFPPRGPIRIVASSFTGDLARLDLLVHDLNSVLEPLGLAPERRRFNPHTTIHRARTFIPPGVRALHFATDPSAPFIATEFLLYQSLLKPGGPEYVKLASFPV